MQARGILAPVLGIRERRTSACSEGCRRARHAPRTRPAPPAAMQSRCALGARRARWAARLCVERALHCREGAPGQQAVAASSEALLRRLVAGGASVVPGFLSEEEEALLAREVEAPLRRGRYQDAHWDGVIHKYRETEKSHWSKESQEILQRVRDTAFPPGVPQLAQVHVLDLDKTGYIKPHIDSVKFCGCTIAGLSLLSSSVMRLVSEQNVHDWLDLLLERRSLYILRGPARYEFTHEILKDEESFFGGRKVPRERRISVICRNLPLPSTPP